MRLNFKAALPMICTTIPILVFFVAYFGRVSLSYYGSLAMALVNWQPCLTPFLSIYFVKPFQRKLFHLFGSPIAATSTLEVQPLPASKVANIGPKMVFPVGVQSYMTPVS